MERPRPAVVGIDAAHWLGTDASPIRVPVARVITKAAHGSQIMLGIAKLAPGQASRWWSFEETDQHRPDEAFLGACDETYFVVRGSLRLTWNDGVLDLKPGDSVHLPPGWHYRLENGADDEAMIVYNVYPALA